MKIISPFLQSDPTQRLIFFDFPCSILHFHQNILPSLKVSLSLTLTHFLPIAGNVVLPLNSGTPAIRCASGDSVSLIIAQSDQNLHYLTSHNQRIADHFYECVPELPLATRFVDSVVFPVIALQITLFAGQGICIGITNHHAVADGSSIVNFVKSWGCANRSGDGEAFHQAVGRHFPVFDRNLVEDHGKLDSIT
ncbi:malonyl-coenzyme:anthocyanin 5-O-glucoside-6'''-O-malonyltransferase-like [Salvia splendens]|uniref:malonyl-coenzyme:anthocyanin 5-O-glucoside-6'''-O-malonyltransferase-like n=1 Tax=Salvia splendens TaxID=180675 RepID=UPI001C27AD05|nr:malonyl-coenzyme:anthocyanin 5-O-glucoside-6'''-O-malonyltransferase-like [Salvia splendens]